MPMPKKILVIDDDPLVLRTLTHLLERNGYSLETAKNGVEGIKKTENDRFDLIICDIRMPEVDGIAAIRKIKENATVGKGSECPVIFVTGYASEEAPIEAIKLSAKDYLLKPFDLDELITSVKSQIG